MALVLLELRSEGLYCGGGDFFVDPWEPVPRAVVTHAHSDHACPGSQAYLAAAPGGDLLRERVEGPVQTANYGERLRAPVEAMLYRVHSRGHSYTSPWCAWPPDWSSPPRLAGSVPASQWQAR